MPRHTCRCNRSRQASEAQLLARPWVEFRRGLLRISEPMLYVSLHRVKVGRTPARCIERAPAAQAPPDDVLDVLIPAPQLRSQPGLAGETDEFVVNDIGGAQVVGSDHAGP